MDLRWYGRRLTAMSPTEVAARLQHKRVQRAWRSRQVVRMTDDPALSLTVPKRTAVSGALPPDLDLPAEPTAALVKAAEQVLGGTWPQFGILRTDYEAPDWFLDPSTGRRAPSTAYAFDVPYRDPVAVGDIKHVWEPSRHHHVPLLAMAWRATGDERFANRAAAHLRSWWVANPFLSGVHWTSGIELGIRVVSWIWTRRLLDGWAGAPSLFDENPVFRAQLHHHQEYLARLHSRGSSANNHVIAEAAGLVVAAAACPWFAESDSWRRQGTDLLVRELEANTFGSGLNRELATEYHGLVLELALVAAIELDITGSDIRAPRRLWELIIAMLDALATVVDVRLHPPRQGDADDGRVLVLDGPDADRWASLLATGAAIAGSPAWWPPQPEADVRATVLAALGGALAPVAAAARPTERRDVLLDAGVALLRTQPDDRPEIWCRTDAGPHGFLSIAAHAHADALAVELRVDGVEVIADPGTFCYHGDPEWRAYFRSTAAHATLELAGVDQSRSGGPFLWSRYATSRQLGFSDDGDRVVWIGEHDGYEALEPPVAHLRTIRFDRHRRVLSVDDRVEGAGGHPCVLTWPLGPDVDLKLDGHTARLNWPGLDRDVTVELDPTLTWSAHRGELDPPLGWYSPAFDRKVPTWLLAGRGVAEPDRSLLTLFHLDSAEAQ